MPTFCVGEVMEWAIQESAVTIYKPQTTTLMSAVMDPATILLAVFALRFGMLCDFMSVCTALKSGTPTPMTWPV